MLRRHSAPGMFLALVFALSPQTVDGAVRTWVSAATGSDLNPCSRQAPCRNFEAAIALTDDGGEVVVLDSGGYGSTVITKSVALISPSGVHAAIAPTGGVAIYVNAAPTDIVILRGLYLNGQGAEGGIDLNAGKSLHIEHCVVSGFPSGIFLHAAGSESYVKNTTIRQNNFGFGIGSTSGPAARASVVETTAEENAFDGFTASDFSNVTLTRCLAAGNGQNGFASLGANAFMTVDSSTSTMNNTGLYTTGTIVAGNTLVNYNEVGIGLTPATKVSLGHNRIYGNVLAGASFSFTINPQ